MLTDQERDDLLAKCPAVRVTKDHIAGLITTQQYLQPEGTLLTMCVLTLANGFTVTGESACAAPENFNEDLGKKIAYENAFNKIWQLEGYLLKQALFLQKATVSAQDDPNIGKTEAA